MKLTDREVGLATTLAVMGFLFSSRSLLLYLNSLTPIEGLMLYYMILYGSLYLLSKMDLVVFGLKISDATQTLGLLLVTFAFFLVINCENAYVQYVTMGNFTGASNVFYASEDGCVFYLWQLLLPQAEVEVLRILTFVVTPFILSIIGGLLIERKIHF